ncbi:trimeric intracellular cation channel family protein [Actinorugispora endophytica]|uniref:Putative membrane protein YeiH n=1 Tax=Actinorugispora endophytica TaxID=1605990 RepID=A0A4R6UVM4_9ACTN|nr:putative membrane protein YeiH [Actinorugispora endophytica]
MSPTTLILILDLAGVFAFAVDGALVGVRTSRIDLVGVTLLSVSTGLGGGIVRDLLLGTTPATFQDWRYVVTALAGALLVFFLNRQLERISGIISFLDSAALTLFCVAGAAKTLELGFGPLQAVLLGAITGVGGGIIRDVLINRIPAAISRDSTMYSVPALTGAFVLVVGSQAGLPESFSAAAGAVACFTLRLAGLRYHWRVPGPLGAGEDPPPGPPDLQEGFGTTTAAPDHSTPGREPRLPPADR